MQQVHLSQPVQKPVPIGLTCCNIYSGHFRDHVDAASILSLAFPFFEFFLCDLCACHGSGHSITQCDSDTSNIFARLRDDHLLEQVDPLRNLSQLGMEQFQLPFDDLQFRQS
jgi:hypothetical protein